jgi:hypothetical protein
MKHGRTFEFVERLPFPAEDVYLVFRDRSRELIPLLPNVESITVLSREQYAPGRTKIVNRWQGKVPPQVPRVLRPFVKPELTAWMDYADWSDAERCVRWRFEMPQAHDLFECSGENWVEADGKHTVVRLKGTVVLYPERLPGMPHFLADRIARPLEKFLLDNIRPNMLEVPDAVRRFLGAQAAS